MSSESTKRIVDNALRLHLIPALGDQPIAAVRPTAIQGFVKKLEAKELSPGTIRAIYHVTSQLFPAAVEDRVISLSPRSRPIKLPKTDAEKVVPPTVEQVTAIGCSLTSWASP